MSTNASSECFCWDFQYNAGVLLMLDYIVDADSVRIEGATEDIEVNLSNGTRIYAQAKSVNKAEDYNNVLRNLTEALRTLATANVQKDACALFYITNSPNPFNSVRTMHSFTSSPVSHAYKELDSICQDKIAKICDDKGYSIDFEKLRVYVFDFFGDTRARFRVVRNAIDELLGKLKIPRDITTEAVLENWQEQFRYNSTKRDTALVVSKKDMMWPLIAWACEVRSSEDALADMLESDVDEIIQKYRSLINDKAERFEFVTKVLSGFHEFKMANPTIVTSKDLLKRFVLEEWSLYADDFDVSDEDENVRELVAKLAICKIVNNSRMIENVKKGVGLCD